MSKTNNEGEITKVDGVVNTEQDATKTPATTEPPKTEPVKTATVDNPAAENTDAPKPKEETTPTPVEPAKEMTAEQFEQYNETLRRVSKTAKTGLQARYNAFEDADVKAAVKETILAGESPDVKNIATDIITRLTPKEKVQTETTDEVVELRAELALVKAGIVPERLDAAKKLFIAEGGDPAKAAEFTEKYPEWKAQAKGVTFTKAQPVNGKTAPAGETPPVMNDFEKKVYAARKARGLPV